MPGLGWNIQLSRVAFNAQVAGGELGSTEAWAPVVDQSARGQDYGTTD